MPRHQSDSIGELSPKKPNIEEKKPKICLTPTASKKDQICEIWPQKSQSRNLGYRACERIVRSLVFIA